MFRQLDELLRGQRTTPEALARGDLKIPVATFSILAIVLGASYGFFMGWFAAFGKSPSNYWQLIASTVKLHALFLLTLLVTLPSLYVFNALIGVRLSFLSTLRLLIAAVVVNVAVAASLGPILGFFTLSTSSYSFMIFLNVALLGLAGVVALSFLLHTLRRLAATHTLMAVREAQQRISTQDVAGMGRPSLGPLEPPAESLPEGLRGQSTAIFRVWVVIYGLVGAQMGWLLRPFIGSPDMPFSWFRERSGNIFQALASHMLTLLEMKK